MNESKELDFESRLKRELHRIDPPEGFAGRVIGRVTATANQERKRRLIVMPGRAAWTAIAAMTLVGIAIGGWQWRQQELLERIKEQRQAALYHQQLDVAMQVTGRTLVVVQERIERAGEIHSAARKREVE